MIAADIAANSVDVDIVFSDHSTDYLFLWGMETVLKEVAEELKAISIV